MGHRHLLNTAQIFESEHEQNWNHMHTEQPYTNLARAGTAENGRFFYPGENMSVEGVNFASHWNAAPSSSGYTSNCVVEGPHYQPNVSGPLHDPFLHQSPAGPLYAAPDNYVHHAAASNYDRQAYHGVEGGFVDLNMGNGRGPHKRKSPGVPSVCERGSTSSRYYNAGTSSEVPLPYEQQEKPNLDPQYMPWDHIAMTPNYRSNNSLSIRGEGSTRNVRSRQALDLESNLARTYLPGGTHTSYPAPHLDHTSSVDPSVQTASALTREWSHNRVSPPHGRMQLSDSSGFSHERDHFLVGSSGTNTTMEMGPFPQEFILGRNPTAPPGFHGTSTQSVRGVRSSYSQRSNPAFRASSSNARVGHVGSSDDGLHLVAESYSNRHSRPLPNIAWRHGDRSGRLRISNERYRALTEEPSLHDRFSSDQGFMIVDRSTLHGSRSMFDQHRDMRLDVDNMTYEELLALGERIGSVSTGLSEDLVSKCLTETIYCSSDQMQEEGSCVICLEEYKNMDDVGTLTACGHDYHVSCIKKWLSMKKLCPICKASVLAEDKE